MKINGKYLKAGQRILHGKSYAVTCSQRFPNVYEDNMGETKGYNLPSNITRRVSEPETLSLQGSGYFIGVKMAIMSNYSYTLSRTTQGFEDSYPETERAYASGKKEECLVLTESLKPFRPYLVRKIDIIST